MKKIKSERINFVISASDKLEIRAAAEKIDVSESELIRRAAIATARKILASDDLEIQIVVAGGNDESN